MVSKEFRQNPVTNLGIFGEVVPKEGFEPTHPYGYYVLNVARLPFRHFGIFTSVVPIHHILTGYLVGDRGLEPLTSCV